MLVQAMLGIIAFHLFLPNILAILIAFNNLFKIRFLIRISFFRVLSFNILPVFLSGFLRDLDLDLTDNPNRPKRIPRNDGKNVIDDKVGIGFIRFVIRFIDTVVYGIIVGGFITESVAGIK